MRVVIAIDSLKGSLSSVQAGNAIGAGVKAACPDAEVVVKPLADGGEGTTDALVEGMGGDRVQLDVQGPLEGRVTAEYGMIGDNELAVMEMAAASGIILVGKDLRPLDTTSYGVGEMICDAVRRGCREFIVGIGGSATNDCGLGMLSALGYGFFDKNGEPVGIRTGDLKKVCSISDAKVLPELKSCHFRVACDVINPLCGVQGATYIYGPQKGVTVDMRDDLDADLAHFAEVTKAYNGTDYVNAEGAGAAGGLGFAFLSFLGADLEPGIELVLDTVQMDDAMEGADLVFTGEGRLDGQTAMGKAPVGIAKLAKKHGAKVVALAGSVTEDAGACNAEGIDAFFPILRQVMTLDEVMQRETAARNLTKTAEQVVRLIAAVQ